MTVGHFSEPDSEEARRRETEQFLLRTSSDVTKMRESVSQLEKGDQACWQELRFLAQQIAGTAAKLQVGIVSACAKEIEKLAEEQFAGVTVDAFFMLCTTSAIETLAMELKRVRAETGV